MARQGDRGSKGREPLERDDRSEEPGLIRRGEEIELTWHKGCEWATLHDRKTNKCIKITHAGGTKPVKDLEIEVDGKLQEDPLKSGKSREVEGKKIRIHVKGASSDEVLVGTEPCTS